MKQRVKWEDVLTGDVLLLPGGRYTASNVGSVIIDTQEEVRLYLYDAERFIGPEVEVERANALEPFERPLGLACSYGVEHGYETCTRVTVAPRGYREPMPEAFKAFLQNYGYWDSDSVLSPDINNAVAYIKERWGE